MRESLSHTLSIISVLLGLDAARWERDGKKERERKSWRGMWKSSVINQWGGKKRKRAHKHNEAQKKERTVGLLWQE